MLSRAACIARAAGTAVASCRSIAQMGRTIRSPDRLFDVVVANPPFRSGHNPSFGSGQLPFPLASSAGALEFLEASMDSLSPRGRCGIIVPDGILFRDEGRYRRARERLLTEFAVIGIIRLPTGTFASAPDVRTNVVLFKRGVSQPESIRYYRIRSSSHRPLRDAPEPGTFEGAVAWVRDGIPDSCAWEVRVKDVMSGDWGLDIPWPREDGEKNSRAAGQLRLFPDKMGVPVQATTRLGASIEKRGASAGGRTVDHILGVSKDGFVPFKGKPASDRRNYRRVEVGDLAYNPMRAALGAIALCRGAHEEGWVSPAYVVFRLTNGASFGEKELLEFLKSPAGMDEVAWHSHGSVRPRLRFKDLCRILMPVHSQEQG
jgi:type I restriction enzyme M protein